MSDTDDFEATIRRLRWANGKGGELTIDDLVKMQPGLARLMPEIGVHTGKCFHAAKAGNWPLARYQGNQVRKLLAMCVVTRPKYEETIGAYLDEDWRPVTEAIAAKDWAAFEPAYEHAVERANHYHAVFAKPWIRWKTPADPPADLVLDPEPGD